MTMRKRRAVRLPLTDVVRNAMIRTLPRYEQKDEYSKENSPYNNGDIAVIWIQHKWNKANGECPLCVTKCDNGKWYLDLVFTDENVKVEGFVTPKCRTLYRVEKYQMRNLDFYLSDWIEDLRMIEYMYDAETEVHHDCYDSLFDPDGFYREQRITKYRIVDEMLIDIVEAHGLTDLFDTLEDLGDLSGHDPYSEAALVDRFVLNLPNRSVYWTYYNPDSDAGGQFVNNTITFDQINEAPTNDPDSFFDHLGSIAKQTLTDFGTPNFVDTAYQVLTEPSDLMGCCESTMIALKQIAAKYR